MSKIFLNRGRKMKGQFFLIGVLLMTLLFYVGISAYLSPSFMSSPIRKDVASMFSNLESEFPRAFNFGLNESSPVSTLVNFTNFAINTTKERNSVLYALWVVTENASDDLNVTVGNFMGSSLPVTLNVSGNVKTLTVGNRATNSSLFTSIPSEFSLIVNFNTTEGNLLLEKYKANLYLILEMRKGTDKIAGEIKA